MKWAATFRMISPLIRSIPYAKPIALFTLGLNAQPGAMRAGFEVFRAFEQVVLVATNDANVFAMLQSILGQRGMVNTSYRRFEMPGNE